MVSEATIDVPSATTTSGAEPQQGASTAHTTPAPTAASDMLPEPSQELPDSPSTATEPTSGEHAGSPVSPAVATKPQTPDLSAGTQNDASSDSIDSPVPNDAGSDAIGSTTANDAESNHPDATTSKSHTAMMESQTPELVQGSQGDGSSTTAGGSLANEASTDTQSDGTSASASPSGTSAGVSLISNAWSHTAIAMILLLSYILR